MKTPIRCILLPGLASLENRSYVDMSKWLHSIACPLQTSCHLLKNAILCSASSNGNSSFPLIATNVLLGKHFQKTQTQSIIPVHPAYHAVLSELWVLVWKGAHTKIPRVNLACPSASETPNDLRDIHLYMLSKTLSWNSNLCCLHLFLEIRLIQVPLLRLVLQDQLFMKFTKICYVAILVAPRSWAPW